MEELEFLLWEVMVCITEVRQLHIKAFVLFFWELDKNIRLIQLPYLFV